ncbi:hypothetical protein Tel_06585 [Candidatus Tenderia electrophaga]|jgi:hypothetical protein|uniref:DUF2007 domain-containing protein n=1 Tax=Candidatus Tenderia electrophaga TaxID=1748243 RepID=A0A0S2TCF6_9GAMM|nr:hypothetical protein Tel_06585 [Candidatus Tenderia electrophaga]
MAVQLFILRGVPEDEAEEIRALLAEQHIDYYETPAGSWGMSLPALWLTDETQLERAQGLLAQYQQQRLSQARSEFEALKAEGRQRSIIDLFREHPLRYLLYLVLVGVIAYFSISPFVTLGQ